MKVHRLAAAAALALAVCVTGAVAQKAERVIVFQMTPGSLPQDSTLVIKNSLFNGNRGAKFWSLAVAGDTVTFTLRGGAFGSSGQKIIAAPGTVHTSLVKGPELDTLVVDRKSGSAYVSVLLWGD